jgi:hypothetical protein
MLCSKLAWYYRVTAASSDASGWESQWCQVAVSGCADANYGFQQCPHYGHVTACGSTTAEQYRAQRIDATYRISCCIVCKCFTATADSSTSRYV